MGGLVIKKPHICGAFLRAAEGTRTLDLLHGKQYCIPRHKVQKRWKSATNGGSGRRGKFGLFADNSAGFNGVSKLAPLME